MFDIRTYRDILATFFVTYGVKLVGAIIILFIGLWVIQWLVNMVNRLMQNHQVDPTLRPFLRNMINVSLKVLLIIAVVAQLGVAMTSVFAVLGSAGLAVGLALQGSLSNLAGGVLILANKPFRVGDYIEAQGVGGRVSLINILNTVIKTNDNKTVYIPNGPLANSTITNYDVELSRRIELKMLLQYGNNMDLAKKLVTEIVLSDQRVLSEPAPQVVTENLELGIAIFTRAWAAREDIGSVTSDLHDRIRTAFEQNQIVLQGPRKPIS